MSGEPGSSAFASALLDPRAPTPAGLRAWNGSDPTRRFDVHRNNVATSLTAALAATFPVVRELVGIDFFQAMVREFIRATPPASPVLAEYGESFADFVAGFAPTGSLPYLADVARLEWLRLQSHHAADAPALAPDALAALLSSPGDLADLRLQAHPATRLLRAGHAAFSLWAAHQGDDPATRLSAVDPSTPEDVLIVRPGIEVRTVRLAPGAFDFLSAILAGDTLAEAAQAASEADARIDLASILGLMLREGAVCGILR